MIDTTTELTWTTACTMAGDFILDEIQTSELPNVEPLMVGPYVRDRSQFVLTVGTSDLGPFTTVDEAKSAATALIRS